MQIAPSLVGICAKSGLPRSDRATSGAESDENRGNLHSAMTGLTLGCQGSRTSLQFRSIDRSQKTRSGWSREALKEA